MRWPAAPRLASIAPSKTPACGLARRVVVVAVVGRRRGVVYSEGWEMWNVECGLANVRVRARTRLRIDVRGGIPR